MVEFMSHLIDAVDMEKIPVRSDLAELASRTLAADGVAFSRQLSHPSGRACCFQYRRQQVSYRRLD